MIPRGPIYFRIRQDVLTTFPTKLSSRVTNRHSFSDWLMNASGSFVVASITNSEFVIRASPIDVAQSLLVEIELFSNHCFEHLQELAASASDTRVRSDSWNVVTIYYFGFFSAQLFTRLVGKPVVYLGRENIQKIKSLGGIPSKLGVGSYVVEKISNTNGNVEEYKVRKTNNSKIHEATWVEAFSYFREIMSDSSVLTDAEEVLLYDSITTLHLRGVYNEGWPSMVRTKANYRPGFSYLGVENNSIAKSKKLIEQWKKLELSKVAQHLDISVRACAPPSHGNYSNHVRLLHDISQTLFIISRQLYSELLERTKIGMTWENRRSAFRKEMAISEADFPAIGHIYHR